MKTEWISVGLDKRLYDRVFKVIKKFPYKSVSDFVGKATLDRVEHLENKIWEEQQILLEVRERLKAEEEEHIREARER